MNKTIFAAIIGTLIVVSFAVCFHAIQVNPQDWAMFSAWLPLYISPIWGIAGYSYITERDKE